jgi:hypothetical protein
MIELTSRAVIIAHDFQLTLSANFEEGANALVTFLNKTATPQPFAYI